MLGIAGGAAATTHLRDPGLELALRLVDLGLKVVPEVELLEAVHVVHLIERDQRQNRSRVTRFTSYDTSSQAVVSALS